jgi:hypothetical protein
MAAARRRRDDRDPRATRTADPDDGYRTGRRRAPRGDNPPRLGRWLRRVEDREIGGYRLGRLGAGGKLDA